MLEVMRGTLQGIQLPARTVSRPRPRRKWLAPPARVEGTPILKLVGIAVMGWFGLMAVVTLLAS